MSTPDTSGPLRVDQVVVEFSLAGGIEAVAFEMQRAFRAAGIDSRVITSVTDAAAPDVERIVPMLARVGSRGRLRHVGRAFVVPAFTLAATAYLAASRGRRNGRIVLSHGDTLSGDVCVVHAVNRANIDMKRAAGAWRWRLNPMHYWVSMRDRFMIGGLRFRRYVALSERVVGELQRYYGVPRDRIALIPNGVNLERYTPGPDDRAATRQSLGLAPQQPTLLFVGHEFDRKGLAHVIDALAAPGLETAILVVAGAGAPSAFVQQAERLGVAGRVRFLGARKDLPELYRAADAFVFPTAYESFSLTCMEALACGLPVFATAVGGIEDYLHDGSNGRVITPDGRAIAAALGQMLQDDGQRDRFKAGALATAAAYGWPQIAERYRVLLEDVRREIADGEASRFGLSQERERRDRERLDQERHDMDVARRMTQCN